MQQTHPNTSIRNLGVRVATLPRSLHLDWAYAAVDKRDLRLDVLRGFAVFAMVVDHWGGASWLYLITGGNNFYVSAAEAFIFISGLVVGMVYGGMALKQGLAEAQVKALKRALTLYKLTVALTLLFAVVSIYTGLPWGKDIQVGDPLSFFVHVATLHQSMYLTDIPMIYTFLMLAVPVALWLLVSGRTWLLLAASTVLWAAAQIYPAQIELPWHIMGSGAFDLTAWQFLFFVAMAMGYHRDAISQKLQGLPRVPYFLLSGLLLIWLLQLHDSNGAILAGLIPGFDPQAWMGTLFVKTMLAPGRLVASFIVFQFAYLAITLFWKPIQTLLGWALLPLGQNALYSYTMHVVAIGLFTIIVSRIPGDPTLPDLANTTLQLLVVLGIWAMIQRRFLFNIVPR